MTAFERSQPTVSLQDPRGRKHKNAFSACSSGLTSCCLIHSLANKLKSDNDGQMKMEDMGCISKIGEKITSSFCSLHELIHRIAFFLLCKSTRVEICTLKLHKNNGSFLYCLRLPNSTKSEGKHEQKVTAYYIFLKNNLIFVTSHSLNGFLSSPLRSFPPEMLIPQVFLYSQP